jgi:hypothetical protein
MGRRKPKRSSTSSSTASRATTASPSRGGGRDPLAVREQVIAGRGHEAGGQEASPGGDPHDLLGRRVRRPPDRLARNRWLEAAAAAAEQEQHQEHDDDDQEQGSESHLASLRVRAPAYPAGQGANQPELRSG